MRQGRCPRRTPSVESRWVGLLAERVADHPWVVHPHNPSAGPERIRCTAPSTHGPVAEARRWPRKGLAIKSHDVAFPDLLRHD